MNKYTADEVINWLASNTNVRVEQLSESTRLEEDLGISGVDASALMSKFSTHFGVDLSDFDFYQHFRPEGFSVTWLFRKPNGMKDHGRYPVTVGHLILVAHSGRWFLPTAINHSTELK
jgi:acyl carrier protein